MPSQRQAPPSLGDLSPQVREAINLVAHIGITQREAARRAGIHEATLSHAMQRDDARELLEQQRALAAMDLAAQRKAAAGLAIQTGVDLMLHAKSEQVRAKLVEFFARHDPPAVSQTVFVNNSQPVDKSGYSYTRPIEDAILKEETSMPEDS